MKVDLSFCEKILRDDDRPRAGLGSSWKESLCADSQDIPSLVQAVR